MTRIVKKFKDKTIFQSYLTLYLYFIALKIRMNNLNK